MNPYLQEKLSSINVYNVTITLFVYLNNSFHCWLVDIHCYFQFCLVASWPFVWKEIFLHHLYLNDNIIRIRGSCKVSPYTFHCVVAFVSWTLVEFLHWNLRLMERNHIFNSTLKFHANENQLDLPKLVLFRNTTCHYIGCTKPSIKVWCFIIPPQHYVKIVIMKGNMYPSHFFFIDGK